MEHTTQNTKLRRASMDSDLLSYIETLIDSRKTSLVSADTVEEVRRLQGGITELVLLLKTIKRSN